MTHRWILQLGSTFSMTGMVVGTLLFVASLTPSLIPRSPFTQGLVSGISLAAGYALGTAGLWLWSYLGIPVRQIRNKDRLRLITVVACMAMAGIVLRQASQWQNDILLLMKLDTQDSAQPFQVGLIALPVFFALLLLARLFRWTLNVIALRLKRFVPERVSYVVAFSTALIFFWLAANGILLRAGLRMADVSFQEFDALMEPGLAKPSDPLKTGSTASLISWKNLGRTGRNFVSSGPTREEIAAWLGAEAMEPIRVYVGLNSAKTPRERAKLAIEELKRVHAFDRSALVIVTPTGTGWIDPAAVDTLEYLQAGDTATVAVQYSYLSSWLSLLVEPSYGAETARALFMTIYDYWTQLPAGDRPKLYLHGLSLGALNSDRAADMFDIIADPFHGALWSGPPFNSETWRLVTKDRNPGSPAWLPRFRDSSIIRFTNQDNALAIPGAVWGPIRIVYLQYASDPITFFDPRILYRPPEWIADPRGPDVAGSFRWFPIVTMLQLAVDMVNATKTPVGFGHTYSPEHYIDAWVHVTDVKWSPGQIARLKSHCARSDRTSAVGSR